jgi:dTDP-4-dehydrorhamnose reductase
VRGFTDELWNGVTTLFWAEACLRALRGETPPGVVQLGISQAVTKHELLALIAEVFELDVRVEGQASGRPLDRRLVPTETAAPLREQLVELRRWY